MAIFTLLTRYVFRVAVSEDVGGQRLAFMITNPTLDDISGQYYSGEPGKDEFYPIGPSNEAKQLDTGKRLWELTENLIRNRR